MKKFVSSSDPQAGTGYSRMEGFGAGLSGFWGTLFWLPGGGIEEGETPDEALVRELQEEAGARLLASRRLGLQSVEDDEGNLEYHAFYWARIELTDDFTPQHEVNVTRHVHPDEFLDTLFWGRSDPKGELLWEMARECEKATDHGSGSINPLK